MTSAVDGPSVRPGPEILDRYRRLPAANVGDAMERLNCVDGAIRPMWRGAAVVGYAFPVTTRPGDNLYLHKALEQVTAGDVLVVNGRGDPTQALLGDLLATRARNAGVAGFVIDGAVRDVDELASMQMPVFARDITAAGPYKNGPGVLGRPAAVGGVVVCAGDLIVADADGVVVVPLDQIDSILQAAEAVAARELSVRDELNGNRLTPSTSAPPQGPSQGPADGVGSRSGSAG